MDCMDAASYLANVHMVASHTRVYDTYYTGDAYMYKHCSLQNSDTKETAVVRGNSTKEIFMLAIPTFFDLIATVLMNIGLLSVTASVYQMMRGAEMLFAALFSVSFLHRSLNRFHLMGILCCVVGALTDSVHALR